MGTERLAGQTAWISGAASGIGAATAELFAEEGARVALIDTNIEGARQVADGIESRGGQALAIACDVAEEDQVHASITQTVAHFGDLHTIVNNAGVAQVRLLHECTEQDWDRLMDVNVKSMFLSTKHGLPHLRRHPRSYIVTIGSISSFVGQAGTPVYTTAKHAVLGLTRSIALDYADLGLRCNCICPGITDTPALRRHLNTPPDPEATLAMRLRRTAMGVAVQPRDVAKAARYFACEDSAGITGTSLVVDRGYLTAAEWEHPGHTAFMDPP